MDERDNVKHLLLWRENMFFIKGVSFGFGVFILF